MLCSTNGMTSTSQSPPFSSAAHRDASSTSVSAVSVAVGVMSSSMIRVLSMWQSVGAARAGFPEHPALAVSSVRRGGGRGRSGRTSGRSSCRGDLRSGGCRLRGRSFLRSRRR
ncbi:hypothetical protein ACFPRL_36450 [Pseudoclavibacter helvolus]